MAGKLNDRQIKSLLRKGESGRYGVGGGLYFRVSKEGSGFWVVRYSVNGRRRETSIGRYPEISLATASLKSAELRVEVRKGIDPLAEKKRPDVVRLNTVNDLAED